MKLYAHAYLLIILIQFKCLNNELIPNLKSEFYIRNELNDENYLKWVNIYIYEDNSTLLQITEKQLKFDTTNKLLSYRPTRNNIFLEAKDFREIIFHIMKDGFQSLIMNRFDYDIHFFKSINPYYVTILLKAGRIFDEKWRGLVFDWREIDSLLKNASSIMYDLNI